MQGTELGVPEHRCVLNYGEQNTMNRCRQCHQHKPSKPMSQAHMAENDTANSPVILNSMQTTTNLSFRSNLQASVGEDPVTQSSVGCTIKALQRLRPLTTPTTGPHTQVSVAKRELLHYGIPVVQVPILGNVSPKCMPSYDCSLPTLLRNNGGLSTVSRTITESALRLRVVCGDDARMTVMMMTVMTV
eukprot:1965643-Rhodomonas_salina.1